MDSGSTPDISTIFKNSLRLVWGVFCKTALSSPRDPPRPGWPADRQKNLHENRRDRHTIDTLATGDRQTLGNAGGLVVGLSCYRNVCPQFDRQKTKSCLAIITKNGGFLPDSAWMQYTVFLFSTAKQSFCLTVPAKYVLQ